jgi:hypothetical protein
MKGKPLKNNTQCENELMQKEALLAGHIGVHPQKKE